MYLVMSVMAIMSTFVGSFVKNEYLGLPVSHEKKTLYNPQLLMWKDNH